MRHTSFFYVSRFTIWLYSKQGYQYLPDAVLATWIILRAYSSSGSTATATGTAALGMRLWNNLGYMTGV